MKLYPSSESKAEQVERVRQMSASDGDGEIWDLSVNDCTALAAVLDDRDELLAACKGLVNTWIAMDEAEDQAVAVARAAIAKAEQR